MDSQPSRDLLVLALTRAGRAHHEYEQVFLGGKRDPQWPGFYAAYVLGQLRDFASTSDLSAWLKEAPADADWPLSAADYVLAQIASHA